MTATLNKSLSVETTALQRSSIRDYAQQAIPAADIQRILSIVQSAPSAWNLQPWRIAVIQNPELQSKLQAASYGQRQVSAAPVVFALYTDFEDTLNNLEETLSPTMNPEDAQGRLAQLRGIFGGQTVEARNTWANSQTNIALGYLLLAIESLGYGSVPMLGFDAAQVRGLLNLPEHVQIAALVPFGVPAQSGHGQFRLSVDRITKYL